MNQINQKRINDPVTIVIFGASGDLTHRKLIPALYSAYMQDLLPEDFTITASSKYCEIEAMENVNLMRFGLQFHPEVNDTEFGTEIMTNFVNFVRKNKN